ncbi:MAG: hypothetical protein Q4C76_02720 [Bacillota bacterium]|nr:hypothetical protein [Bacillota bacterium]
MTDSILSPAVGENQRFCYDVVAVGEDSSLYADLSHLVLGICDGIPAEEIVNITVVINDVPQEVVFGEGGNVELRTDENPDPPTGCPGLKFDFALDKVYGRMRICIELTVAREVAGIDVCLFGGSTIAEGLRICGPTCEKQTGDCPAIGYQRSTVCVPVTVTPFARVGTPITSCCGAPVVTAGDVCPRNGGVCRFTISQQICVAVPVEFGARAVAGTPSVQCGEVSSTNICADCTPADTAFTGKQSTSKSFR